jgi:hypothetical protein
MRDPIIVARGTDNIVISYPTNNNSELVQSIVENMVELYGSCKVIERDSLPFFYPEFYDAINLQNGFENINNTQNAIIYDINKAKEILKDMWRKAREPLLQALDTEYIIALERRDSTKIVEVTSKKQQLRDVTNLEIPNNFQELQNFWPEILGSHPYKVNI